MAFDPDKYLAEKTGPAPGFNPDAYLAAKGVKVDSPVAAATNASSPAQTGLESFANTATLGYLPQLQAGAGAAMGLGNYTDLRDKNIARQKASAEENPKSDIAGKVAGFGANVLMGPTNIPGIAAQAALSNPGDTPGQSGDLQLGDRAKNAALAGLLGKGLQGIGNKLGGAADSVMQRAAGIRKPAVGLGTELIDQGIIGTRGNMQRQVADKIAQRGTELSNEVGSMSGDIDVTPIAKALQEKASSYNVGGHIPPNLQGSSDQYGKLAEFLQQKGSLSPKDLLKFKQQQGDAAYLLSGNPGTSDAAQAARTAMAESGNALKSSYASQNALEDPNRVADINQKLAALFKAKDGLKRGSSLSGLAEYGGLAGLGALAGGAPGMIAGTAVRSPLIQSVSAHLAHKSGKLAGEVSPEIARLLSLFPASREQ